MPPSPPPPDFWNVDTSKRAAAAALAGLMVAAAGCGDDDETEQTRTGQTARQEAPAREKGGFFQVARDPSDFREYVGAIEGTDIYFAAIVLTDDGERVGMAYACDGDEVGEFFRLEEDGARPVFSSRKGSKVRAAIDGDTLRGQLTLSSGESHDIAADEVELNGKAGLYLSDRAIDKSGRLRGADWGGWIVLPDGTQRGNTNVSGSLRDGGKLNTTDLHSGGINARSTTTFIVTTYESFADR